jgi:hypothetical protein
MDGFLDSFSGLKLPPSQEQLLEIEDHMRDTINEIALIFAETSHGFDLLRQHLEGERESILEQLSEMFPGKEVQAQYDQLSQLLVPYALPKEPDIAPVIGTTKGFREAASPDSKHLRTLASSLLVTLYQYWEHTWRPGIQNAVRKEIGSDFWGEVCKIRDCLLHNKGRANRDYVRRARVLRWFEEGQPIEIDSAKFSIFVREARHYCDSFAADLM